MSQNLPARPSAQCARREGGYSNRTRRCQAETRLRPAPQGVKQHLDGRGLATAVSSREDKPDWIAASDHVLGTVALLGL